MGDDMKVFFLRVGCNLVEVMKEKKNGLVFFI